MIDIHCHILPGMDDGPGTLTESLVMAKQAAKLGVKKIIATPHHRNGTYYNERHDILLAVDYLNIELRNEKIPIQILPGQVTRIYNELLEDLMSGKILTMNETTRYINIDLPSEIPINIDRLIYEIQMAGYIPVISNPETNPSIYHDPNHLYRLIKNGALANMAAPSIVGAYGKKIQKLSEKLLNASLIHFIGSNAHNNSKRGFLLSEAIAQLKKIDVTLTYQLIQNNDALVNGHSITKHEPKRVPTSKRWLFSR